MEEGAARTLERELDRIAPRFADAVMDPSTWGMARSFVQAMVADGVEVDDQAAVDRWIARQNVRAALEDEVGPDDDEDEDEDFDLKEAFDLPDRLPPMRLPPLAGLAPLRQPAAI